MAPRYRRRSEWQDGSGLAMFGGAGWLFADLMLALAVAFLVADTVSTPSPPSPPKAAHSRSAVRHRPTPTPTPSPSPSASPSGPALDLGYITAILTISPASLQAGSARAKASVRTQVARISGLTGRRAGLVLLFAGDLNPDSPTDYDAAISLDQKLARVLTGLSIDGGPVFQVAVYRDFANYGSEPDTVELNIYLFKR
jgi:hypothetical protein